MIFTDSSQKCLIKALFTLCQIAFVPLLRQHKNHTSQGFSQESAYFCNGAQLHYTNLLSEGSHIGWVFTRYWIYNHGQKSCDTFAFLGHFPIHTGPTPTLTPQTMLDACLQNFFSEFQLCIGWGEGELQEKISKRMHCLKREPRNDREI